jgi:hypothetical protein
MIVPMADDAAITGEVHQSNGKLVPQPHGGSILRGDRRRLPNPTAADVAADAQEALYRLLPRLKKIARNEGKRLKKKDGTVDKRSKGGKPPYSVAEQLRAFSTLKEVAMLDKTVRASDVDEFLRGMVDDVRGFLEPGQADALLAMLGRRALRL